MRTNLGLDGPKRPLGAIRPPRELLDLYRGDATRLGGGAHPLDLDREVGHLRGAVGQGPLELGHALGAMAKFSP